MGSTRWRKVARDVWLHKARTFLALAAISIGLVGAGTVLDAWALVRRATVEQYAASHPPAMTLTVDSVDSALLARVRAQPGVAAVRARHVSGISTRVGGETISGEMVVLDDFSQPGIGMLSLERGRWPGSDSTIVIERSSVDMIEAAIGSAVELRAGNGETARFTVSGIARDVGIPPGWMDHHVTVFATRAALLHLGLGSHFDQVQATLAGSPGDITIVRRAARGVARTIEQSGRRVLDIDVPVPGRHPHAAQMDSLLFTQGAFGALALALSAFLVLNLISAMLAGRMHEIGIMKAIGARREQIGALYLVMAGTLGVIACIFSIPLAVWAGRAYATFVAQMLNFDVAHVPLPLPVLMLQAGVGIFLPVAAAAVPVARACGMSVVAALRGDPIAGRGVHENRWWHTKGLSRAVSLALDMIARRPARAAMTVFTLACGGAVFLGARMLRTGVVDSVDGLYKAYHFDVSLRFAESHDADSLESVTRSSPTVRAAESWTRADATIRFADGSSGNRFTISGLPPATALFRPRLVAGRWLAADDVHALVVARRLAMEQPSLAVGASLSLVVNGRRQDWTVVGTVDAGIDDGAYASRADLERVPGAATPSGVVVAFRDTSSALRVQFIQGLRDEFAARGMPVLSAHAADDGREGIEDHLVMVVWFLGAMAQMIVVIGGLGLASTLSIGVIERTREIGVLRAIGATPGTVQLLVHTESLCFTALSWVLAVLLSIPIARVLGRVFGNVMFPVPVSPIPDAISLIEWLLLVIALGAIAAFLPARRASRIQVSDALAYA